MWIVGRLLRNRNFQVASMAAAAGIGVGTGLGMSLQKAGDEAPPLERFLNNALDRSGQNEDGTIATFGGDVEIDGSTYDVEIKLLGDPKLPCERLVVTKKGAPRPLHDTVTCG
jgi:hypothetical protein